MRVFLVSFSDIDEMLSIITRIRSIVSEIPPELMKKFTRDELLTHYFSSKIQNPSENVNPSLGIGIIDNVYPIILVGKKDWQKRIKFPQNSDKISAEKTGRSQKTNGTIFHLNIESINGPDEKVSFNLPNGIAEKIIDRIDRTEFGEKIFDLDIPMIVNHDGATLRRIIHVVVNLPDKEDYLRTIRSAGFNRGGFNQMGFNQ